MTGNIIKSGSILKKNTDASDKTAFNSVADIDTEFT